MVRGTEGVASAVNFYHHALGLHVNRVTDDWAELVAYDAPLRHDTNTTSTHTESSGEEYHQSLQAVSGVTLSLQAVHSNEAQLTTGYSPWLTFEVADMDQTITKAMQSGAHLDGPIQYPAHGKVAVLRSPDHHMIGLYEPTTIIATSDQWKSKR